MLISETITHFVFWELIIFVLICEKHISVFKMVECLYWSIHQPQCRNWLARLTRVDLWGWKVREHCTGRSCHSSYSDMTLKVYSWPWGGLYGKQHAECLQCRYVSFKNMITSSQQNFLSSIAQEWVVCVCLYVSIIKCAHQILQLNQSMTSLHTW